MVSSTQSDQVLLQQVLSFAGLGFIAFVESALGQVPLFYGSGPKLLFCLVFAIGVRYPKLLPLITVVVLGLIFDLLQSNPFGYSSSLYLIILVYAKIRHNILIETDAMHVWAEFALLVFGLMIYMMTVFWFYTGAWPPFGSMLFQAISTIFLFPIINWMFDLGRSLRLYFRREK
jgi:cell shape-determining protein MreD